MTEYNSRLTRHAFIAETFRSYLSGSVLNIGGGGKKHLLKYLKPTEYMELDIDGEPDLRINLDQDFPLPVENDRFDTVLCTDVLEHLEEFHQVFQELLRISSNYVIISLPNSLKIVPNYIRRARYQPDVSLLSSKQFGAYSKFYGLPLERPVDRHRWFFSYTEAENFFHHHAATGKYRIVEEFPLGLEGSSWKSRTLRALVRPFVGEPLFKDIFASVYWCVLEKTSH